MNRCTSKTNVSKQAFIFYFLLIFRAVYISFQKPLSEIYPNKIEVCFVTWRVRRCEFHSTVAVQRENSRLKPFSDLIMDLFSGEKVLANGLLELTWV